MGEKLQAEAVTYIEGLYPQRRPLPRLHRWRPLSSPFSTFILWLLSHALKAMWSSAWEERLTHDPPQLLLLWDKSAVNRPSCGDHLWEDPVGFRKMVAVALPSPPPPHLPPSYTHTGIRIRDQIHKLRTSQYEWDEYSILVFISKGS